MDPHTRLLHAKAILWWIGAGSLSVSTIYFIGNICITIQVLQTKKFISWMPIMSGVTGAIGLGFMFPDHLAWCWIPLIVDWTVPMAAWATLEEFVISKFNKAP